jgi:hypothetical protein
MTAERAVPARGLRDCATILALRNCGQMIADYLWAGDGPEYSLMVRSSHAGTIGLLALVDLMGCL